MLLHVRLDAVVGERLLVVIGRIFQKLGKLLVSNNLTTILGVLEVVIANLLANVLGNIYKRSELLGVPSSKLGHIF